MQAHLFESHSPTEERRSLGDPALGPDEIQKALREAEATGRPLERIRTLAREAVMQDLEGRGVVGAREKIREVGGQVGLEVRAIEQKARREYTPPREVESKVPDRSHFPYAHVALAISRQEWPPEPRRGNAYSDTQLREEIAHGAKGLPLRTGMDRFGAGDLKKKATDLGLPEALFEGRASWSPGKTFMGLCTDVERPLHPDKHSPTEVQTTPAAVAELMESKVFRKVENELELWDWVVEHAPAINEEESAAEVFEVVSKMKTIGPTGTSKCTLGKRILYYCQGVTLGETVFGSGRKRPPYASTAGYDKDIPRFHELWRDRTEISFTEALRRRREYEAAIEEAQQASERRAAQALRDDLTDVLFPFFDWYVDNGWSETSLSALSRKWSEFFEDAETSPRLHRSRISGEIVIEGDGVGRRYRPAGDGVESAETEVRVLIHFVGHARRLLLLRAVTDRSGLHRLLRDARTEAKEDLARERTADELYEAVGELLVDKATKRADVNNRRREARVRR